MAVDAFSLLPYGHHLIINQNELVVAKPISCGWVKLYRPNHPYLFWLDGHPSILPGPTFYLVLP